MITHDHLLTALAMMETMGNAQQMEQGHMAAWLSGLQDPLRDGEDPGTPQELAAACKQLLKDERFWPGLNGLLTAMRRVRAQNRAALPSAISEEDIQAREEIVREWFNCREDVIREVRELVGDPPPIGDTPARIAWAIAANKELAANLRDLQGRYGLAFDLHATQREGLKIEIHGFYKGARPAVLGTVVL